MYSRSLQNLASQVDSPEYFASTDEEVTLPDATYDKENQPNVALVGLSDKYGPREKSNLISNKLSEDQTRDKIGSHTYSSLINAA